MQDYQSRSYKSLLEKWAKPILDTLDNLDSLPEDVSTANAESIVAEILFSSDLLTISRGEAYRKTPQFPEFYARFKQTHLYREMEEIRRVKTANSM